MDIAIEVQKRLNEVFKPSLLEVIDESDQHKGHAGSKNGAKHFKVVINAEIFTGLSKIEIHRNIYQVLIDLIPFPLHALRIIIP